MMKILYQTSHFIPPRSGGALDVTWAELVHAAVTYGKSSSCYHLSHPGHSMAEKRMRRHFLYACLRQAGSSVLPSDLYTEMDATEKSFSSYFLGMTLTKLFAARILDVPLLWHVSKSSQAISFRPGNSRPDLIGCSSNVNSWIVAEAKGRSGGFDRSALASAKDQSRMVSWINGSKPTYRVGCQAYFAPCLRFKLEDPPAKRRATPVKVEVDAALREYYSILPVLKESGTVVPLGQRKFRLLSDDTDGVTIGLPMSFDLQDSQLRMAISEFASAPKPECSPLEFVGNDGFYVGLDERWSEREMVKQPHLRG